MTAIQSLPVTIGLPAECLSVLDALRRKRNLSDYTGEEIDESFTDSCIHEAKQLMDEVQSWLKQSRPDLVGRTS